MLAEKTQTIISRGLANTRMRDFYDLYEIAQKKDFSFDTYKNAFYATCKKRGTEFSAEKIREELNSIASSDEMNKMWDNFKRKNYFVEDIEYQVIMEQVLQTIMKIVAK